MVKVFVVSSFLIFNLHARENPFFPTQGEQDLPYTSNEKKITPKLSRVSLSLPSTARLIKKVTIEYENLDASIDTESIDLDNTVDWHLPIFVSQSYAKLDSKLNKQKSVKNNRKIQAFKEVAKIKHASFLISKNSLKIKTKDSLIRNFLLGQPHRIVIDFKRESNLRSYIKTINNSVFTKVRVGNHKGYYRVVIELDGYYRYKLKKVKDGCLITLR